MRRILIIIFFFLAITNPAFGESLSEDILQFREDVSKMHDIIHGGPTSTVATEGGDVPTVANAIADISNTGAQTIADISDEGAQVISDISNTGAQTIADISDEGAQVISDISNTGAQVIVDISNFIPRGAWQTGTAYVLKDLVTESGTVYVCTEAHTAGTFATDLTAGKWAYYQVFDNTPRISQYGNSLTNAKAALGSNETDIVIDAWLTPTADDTIPETWNVKIPKGAGGFNLGRYSLRDANYEWLQSAAAANEYYLIAAGGGDPGINEPKKVFENTAQMTAGTLGSLAAFEWAWGNNDGLPFNTLYVRLADDADPDTKTEDFVEAGVQLFFNGKLGAGRWQVFDDSGGGSVVFGTYAGIVVYPELWGAAADNSTSGAINAGAFASMIASLPSANVFPKIELTYGGRYLVTGNPAVAIDIPCIIEWNNAIFDYGDGTGTCLQIGGPSGSAISDVHIMNGPNVRRNWSNTGAISQFQGTGIYVRNTKNFFLTKPQAAGFEKGLSFYGDNQGVSYGNIYDVVSVSNKYCLYFDSANHADAFCTHLTFYGGRTGIASTLSSYTGSRLIYIGDTGAVGGSGHVVDAIRFYGTAIESRDVERKVECRGQSCVFDECYWDDSNGGIDITYGTNSGYNLVKGGPIGFAQVIEDFSIIGYNYRIDPREGIGVGTATVSGNLLELRRDVDGGAISTYFTNGGSGVSTSIQHIYRAKDSSGDLQNLGIVKTNCASHGANFVEGERQVILTDSTGTSRLCTLTTSTLAANETAMWLLVYDGSTYNLSRVTIGATDSGGAGYRALRVPN